MTIPTELLKPAIELVATAIGAWLLHRVASPKAHERAALLSTIAAEAAAWVVAHNPGKPWAEVLEAVVQRIAVAAGLPTKNATAIENAAAAALTQLGQAPNARK